MLGEPVIGGDLVTDRRTGGNRFMLFADLSLARRLEATDAIATVEYARSWAASNSYVDPFALSVAGGHAGFAGVDSPLTQAFGLGLNGPVTELDLEQLETFFRSRGASVNIETCPLADHSLFGILGERGYGWVEFSNVLVRELSSQDACEQDRSNSMVRIRRPLPEETDAVSLTLGRSFFERAEPNRETLRVFDPLFRATSSYCLVAETEGVVAGAAMVGLFGGVAALGSAGTLPEYRDRGIQRALILARLEFAALRGCDLAMVATAPGSVSQRNVERQGFRIADTRTKYCKN